MEAIRVSQKTLKVVADRFGMESEEHVREMFDERSIVLFEPGIIFYMIFDFPVKDSDLVLDWIVIRDNHFRNLYEFDKVRIEKEFVTIEKKNVSYSPHIKEEHESHEVCDFAWCR